MKLRQVPGMICVFFVFLNVLVFPFLLLLMKLKQKITKQKHLQFTRGICHNFEPSRNWVFENLSSDVLDFLRHFEFRICTLEQKQKNGKRKL